MLGSVRQLVLDFDGVIADGTNRTYIELYTEAVRKLEPGLSAAQIEEGIVRHWGESPRRELAAVLGDSHPGLAQALAYYQRHIDDRLVAAARPLPGAREAVTRLARSYPIHLISGMGAAPLERILRAFGLRRFFKSVVSTSGSELAERQKASGHHLRELCRREGLAPAETLCVGDAASDVAMARNAGVPVILVLTGALDRAGAEALGVAWILDSLAALPELIIPPVAGCSRQ